MSFSKIFTSIFAVVLLTVMSLSSVSAHTVVLPTDNPTQIEAEAKIKIKIIIIIIIKKKKSGVFEVVGMREGNKDSKLAQNEVLAEVTRDDNNFQVQPLRGKLAKSQFIMPASFKASKELSLKLGSERPIGFKAGRADFKTSKLGNFEIQD